MIIFRLLRLFSSPLNLLHLKLKPKDPHENSSGKKIILGDRFTKRALSREAKSRIQEKALAKVPTLSISFLIVFVQKSGADNMNGHCMKTLKTPPPQPYLYFQSQDTTTIFRFPGKSKHKTAVAVLVKTLDREQDYKNRNWLRVRVSLNGQIFLCQHQKVKLVRLSSDPGNFFFREEDGFPWKDLLVMDCKQRVKTSCFLSPDETSTWCLLLSTPKSSHDVIKKLIRIT